MSAIRTTTDSATYRRGVSTANTCAQYLLERISRPILVSDKEALIEVIRAWPELTVVDDPAVEVPKAAIPARFQNLPKRGRRRREAE